MNIAVIFAGGVGSRMQSKGLPKQFLSMHGRPIIAYTIEVFQETAEIDAIVISCVAEWIDHLKEIVRKYKFTKVVGIVPGGETGQLSIYSGLCEAERIAGDEKSIVLIHDGVRPLISEKTIVDNIESVKERGSGITCVPLKETVLATDETNLIKAIPDRDSSRLARAPQSFWLHELLEAHRRAMAEDKLSFIDSCSMMKYYGKELYLVDGPEINIKVTTLEDFYIMRALIDAKENAQIYGVEE